MRLPRVEGTPDAVPLLAEEIAGTATTPLEIARKLESALADNGWFSHGVSETDYPSLSGHGADRIITLLTGSLMVGDDEQYASAMALMARHMGLPARVVVGFAPDEDSAGAAQIVITGDDIEAWVEIQFADRGWVAFDPTPNEDRVPQDDTPEQLPNPQPQIRQPPPPLQDPVDPPEDEVDSRSPGTARRRLRRRRSSASCSWSRGRRGFRWWSCWGRLW